MNDPASLANAFANKMTDKRIEVLRKIAETGSISQAARETGISYKAAWPMWISPLAYGGPSCRIN